MVKRKLRQKESRKGKRIQESPVSSSTAEMQIFSSRHFPRPDPRSKRPLEGLFFLLLFRFFLCPSHDRKCLQLVLSVHRSAYLELCRRSVSSQFAATREERENKKRRKLPRTRIDLFGKVPSPEHGASDEKKPFLSV